MTLSRFFFLLFSFFNLFSSLTFGFFYFFATQNHTIYIDEVDAGVNKTAVLGLWHSSLFPLTKTDALLNMTYVPGKTYLYVWSALSLSVSDLNFTLRVVDDGTPTMQSNVSYTFTMVLPSSSSALTRGEIAAIACSLISIAVVILVVGVALIRRHRHNAKRLAPQEEKVLFSESPEASFSAEEPSDALGIPDTSIFNVSVRQRVQEIEHQERMEKGADVVEHIDAFAGLVEDGNDVIPPYIEVNLAVSDEVAKPAVQRAEYDLAGNFNPGFTAAPAPLAPLPGDEIVMLDEFAMVDAALDSVPPGVDHDERPAVVAAAAAATPATVEAVGPTVFHPPFVAPEETEAAAAKDDGTLKLWY